MVNIESLENSIKKREGRGRKIITISIATLKTLIEEIKQLRQPVSANENTNKSDLKLEWLPDQHIPAEALSHRCSICNSPFPSPHKTVKGQCGICVSCIEFLRRSTPYTYNSFKIEVAQDTQKAESKVRELIYNQDGLIIGYTLELFSETLRKYLNLGIKSREKQWEYFKKDTPNLPIEIKEAAINILNTETQRDIILVKYLLKN